MMENLPVYENNGALGASDLRRMSMIQYRELGEIINCLHEIEGTSDIKRRCEVDRAFVKAISLIPDNGYVITITGMQGVGKSTLVNAILGITGTEYALPEGLGRCEKVPVLVRTLLGNEIHHAHVLPVSFTGDAADNLIPIDFTKARDIALGENLEDGRESILVDYPLPNESNSILPGFVYFLLLPGYEKKAPWADLGMAAMLLADHAVFVMDDSSLASKPNRELLAETMNRFGTDGLTVVFSKMDRAGQNSEELETSLNALGVGYYSNEKKNLFRTGVPSDKQDKWQGIVELREALFEKKQAGSTKARSSRVKQLALKMKQFAEDDLEELVFKVQECLERGQAGQFPIHKIYFRIMEHISKCREKAGKAVRKEIQREISTIFNKLPKQVEEKIYDEASGFNAFIDSFNPWQDYGEQQHVKLSRLMKSMVNQNLEGVPIRSIKIGLETFKENLPVSMFDSGTDYDDKGWYEYVQFSKKLDIKEDQAKVTEEFLSAGKPICDVMIEIIERASKAGQIIDKKVMADIAINVMEKKGINNIRRGLFALGLVEAADVGFEVAGAVAGENAATAAAGASLGAPLAVAAGIALVAISTALCLRSSKNYKVNASRQAEYLVASSKESIENKLVESMDQILDWFHEKFDEHIRKQLGMTRQLHVQYRLAVQCERIRRLRSATLIALGNT